MTTKTEDLLREIRMYLSFNIMSRKEKDMLMKKIDILLALSFANG